MPNLGQNQWFFLSPVTFKFDRWPSLQWGHNGQNGISNHQPHDCLLNHLFKHRSQKTSKFCTTGLCAGNSPGTGEFPAQRASSKENVSIWWRHHVKNNRAPLLCYFKLCASFCNCLWICTGATVRKSPNWGKICLTSVILTFDLWSRPFTWTLHLPIIIITPENFRVIRWPEHYEKVVTDGRMDRQTDRWK